MSDEPEVKQYPTIRRLEPDEEIKLIIPICCVEGHDDCPHVVKKEKPKKTNVGL